MAQVSTYLNFAGNTEEAFDLYRSVFGTEFAGPIMRHGDVPQPEGAPPVSDADKNLIINIALPILADHLLMGTDIPESMGYPVQQGNNVYICLHPDTRGEADRIFAALSEGGQVENALAEMFWGDYWGSFSDKFGIHWMINCSSKE
jgi:PhnB protein